ncbi:MAG TPA: insulinase family protein [Armatimonadetes bacterium]|nr:insulinase family protein [Armatimonadota bacterium]
MAERLFTHQTGSQAPKKMNASDFTSRQQILDHGALVAALEMPWARAVSVGLWLRTGSQDETPANSGISHFLEHMVFKGTTRRTAAAIAGEIESVGGQLDAFTEKEYTCYYFKVLPQHLALGLDIVTDMIVHPLLQPQDIELEKKVVLDEIRSAEDSPEELVFDLLPRTCWGNHPLGQPVLGREENLNHFSQPLLRDYLQGHYTAARVLVAAAGPVDFQALVSEVERGLSDLPASPNGRPPVAPTFHSAWKFVPKGTKQVQLCLGLPGCSRHEEERYPLAVLDCALGGGMSSRLFQEIREKRGLAYSIGTAQASYHNTGLFTIGAGTSPQTAPLVLEIILRELKDLASRGLSGEELQRAKEQLKASLILSLETTSAHMNWLARSLLYYGRQVPLEEVLTHLDQVTPADVIRVTRERLAAGRVALAVVGGVEESEVAEWWELVSNAEGEPKEV